jgi:glucose-1-phosphate cytidylyltransferase
MTVVILAGGFGTRLSEETDIRPKPMVEIGGKPILWHIMKTYSHYGFNEFIILLGYKGYYIKEYFANYFRHESDLTINLVDNSVEYFNNKSEPWKITLIDTGLNSMTGARIKKAQKLIGDNPFLLTYGDGVGNIDIQKLLDFHQSHSGALTVTSTQPDGRFGALVIDDNKVIDFQEKPKGDGNWINAGFFVCDPKVFDYISEEENTIFEQQPLKDLARNGEVFTYQHTDFWMPMDTLRDKNRLNELWDNKCAPWKVWN